MKKNTSATNISKLRYYILFFLILSMVLSALWGCSATDGQPAAAGSNEQPPSSAAASEQGGTNDPAHTAMGRYTETVIDLRDAGLSGYNQRLFATPEGNLLVTSTYSAAITSADSGDTWTTESYAWLQELINHTTYIVDYAIAPDQTAAVVYDRSADEDGFDPGMMLVTPDGTQIPVDLPLSDSEMYPTCVWISDSGRIFCNALGESNIYEVKTDGTAKKFLSLTGSRPDLIQFCGDLMIIGGYGYDGLLLYDMASESYTEDEVLNRFITDTYGATEIKNGAGYYDLYFFTDEENVLYVAGSKGLHRHVIGGSAVEQVIDGSLCSFGNPAYGLLGVVPLRDNAFGALFGDNRFVRYTYDPTVPTVPSVKLEAYSLTDNSLLRMAISNYQSSHPDIYVQYEVGMEDNSAITKDDALKKLNTRIMSGEGPDILLLDDMPLDSYIEKGLLSDLSGFAESLTGEDALFPNIVEAFRRDGKLYALPCTIEIPVFTCSQTYTPLLADGLEGVAQTAEMMQEDLPGYDLAGTMSEKGILKLFTPVCAPSWITEQNTIDTEKLSDFLTQAKRIYDAQTNTISERDRTYYEELNQSFLAESGHSFEDSANFGSGIASIKFLMSDRGFEAGTIRSATDFAEIISLPKTDGCGAYETVPTPGQCSHVFKANSLAGISAASSHQEQAQDLLKEFLVNVEPASESLPINQAAFEKVMTPNPDFFVSYDTPYLYTSSSDGRGLQVDFDIYWPTEEEVEVLRNWINEAEIPYISNSNLEDAVYTEGTAFMQGKQSLKEAVDQIEKTLALQMAE